jgi:hypothetical protein
MRKIVVFVSVLCVACTLAAAGEPVDQQDPLAARMDDQEKMVSKISAESELKKACVKAMNADPQFAASIVATVDRQIDNKTLAAHADADYHIRKNQRHVVYAYAAMWLIAVAFVWFLFRRQIALQTEIEALRRDLDAAAKESA